MELHNGNERPGGRHLDDEASHGCGERVPPRTGSSTAADVTFYRILHPPFERDEQSREKDQFDQGRNRGAPAAPPQRDRRDAERRNHEEDRSQHRAPAGAWVAQPAEISPQEQCRADGAAEQRRKLNVPARVEPVSRPRPLRFSLHAASLDRSGEC